MPISYRITEANEEDRFTQIFGQIVFSGNYTTGGDTLLNASGNQFPEAIPPGTPSVPNTASLSVFTGGQTSPHVTRTPLAFNVQIESGYNAVLVPGSGAFNFKIKILDPATKAELPNGAYPAAITSAVFNYLELRYKKNI